VVWIGSCTEVWVPSWWCYWEVIGPPGLTSSVGESINDLIAEWAVRRWGLPGGSGHCGVHLKGMSICKSLPLPLTLFLGHHEVSNSTLPHTPRHDGLSDHGPGAMEPGDHWTEISETMSQNKSFFFQTASVRYIATRMRNWLTQDANNDLYIAMIVTLLSLILL
jgi:hypothetical protein